jgi:hypothetical protein
MSDCKKCTRRDACNLPCTELSVRMPIDSAIIAVRACWGEASCCVGVTLDGKDMEGLLGGCNQVANFRHNDWEALRAAAYNYYQIGDEDENEEEAQVRRDVDAALDCAQSVCLNYDDEDKDEGEDEGEKE